jgi:hypothetical protein
VRAFEDPFNREQLLILLRQGNTLTEACKAMGFSSTQKLRQERDMDVTFSEQIVQAQGSAFNPVMRRLIEKATHGDDEEPATLKAWELVTRHYNKALDRAHDHDKIEHVAERQAALDRPKVPGLTRPDDVAQLLAAIKEAKGGGEDEDESLDDDGEGTAGTGRGSTVVWDTEVLPGYEKD